MFPSFKYFLVNHKLSISIFRGKKVPLKKRILILKIIFIIIYTYNYKIKIIKKIKLLENIHLSVMQYHFRLYLELKKSLILEILRGNI